MKKRFLFIFSLIFCFSFLFVGCGKKDNNTNSSNEYKIDFVVDGSVYARHSIKENETTTIPEDPTKNGYIFDGWYFDNNTFNNKFSKNTYLTKKPTENAKVYAKWTVAPEMSIFEFTSTQNSFTITGLKRPINHSLTSVTIPAYVTHIAEDVFSALSNIEVVNISSIESWCNIEFANKKSNPLTSGGKLYLNGSLVTTLQIPESVKQIKNYAFILQRQITSVSFPSNLENIGNYAFYYCDSIKYLNIPNKVTTIGEYSFFANTSLTTVDISASVTKIGNSAFFGCSNLTHVALYLNSKLTTIENMAFGNCSKLTNLTIPSLVNFIGADAFYECSSITQVTFMNATNWKIYSSENSTVGTSVTLTNKATAATLLTETHAHKYWKHSA